MSPIGNATSAQRSSGSNDEDHGNDEVADLHDIVERRLLPLEEKDETGDDETRDKRLQKRGRITPVKESLHAGAREASFSRALPVIRKTVQSSSGFAPMRL